MLSVLAVAVVVSFVSGAGLAVEADANGFFESGYDRPATDEVFAGPGVTFVTADGESGGLYGRVDLHAAETSVWERSADGALTPHALRVAHGYVSHRADAVSAVIASLGEPRAGTVAAFAETLGAPPGAAVLVPAGDTAAPSMSRSPAPLPAASEPLESWAPSEDLFVRFRSVEAAYRFAEETDRLVASLLASEQEDARDYGSLRLTLHDLVLPTIWRTNPDAERGVGEVGLVVAPPFVRGRLCVAALFRITDPELHLMQTVAGLAQQAASDHVWAPADDPFPAERRTSNFRRIPFGAPDLEIVATDAALGERIASRKSAVVAGAAGFHDLRAATVGGDGHPVKEEAAFAFSAFPADDVWRALVPGLLRSALREMREGVGLRWLAERWLGRADAPSLTDPHPRGPAVLASIRAIRVVTDVRGAAVVVTCADAESARRLAGSLRSLESAGPAANRACLHNLADLVPLALVENPQDDVAERNFVVLGWKPVCPCGGTYSVHPVTREVSCSVHGTVAAPKAGKWTPPPVSEVKSEGTELSFRLAIDWDRKQ